MSKAHPKLIERIEAIALPVVEGEGLKLLGVEFQKERRGWILRLYIDKEGGLSLTDCETVSHQLGDILDVEDLIDHPYTLEVSSPGLDRPLRREADFIRFAGRRVRVITSKPLGGRSQFIGCLRGLEGGNVILEEDGSSAVIPYSAIAKARLEVEF